MSLIASTSERTSIRRELLVRVYRSKNDREWYWQIKNRGNHVIEGASSQGYDDQRGCTDNLWRMTGFEPDVIVDEGE